MSLVYFCKFTINILFVFIFRFLFYSISYYDLLSDVYNLLVTNSCLFSTSYFALKLGSYQFSTALK